MKKWIFIIFLLIFNFGFAEVEIKVHEPIRFKNYNMRGLSSNKLVGMGILEVSTDNGKEDLGKKLVFKFPQNLLMTNKRRVLEAEKIGIESRDDSMILMKKTELVKVYVVIDKSELRGKDVEKFEGEYIGELPIIISQYKKQ